MLYALLCYNSEEMVFSWDKDEESAVMNRLGVVRDKLSREGKLGPSLRLMPSTAATTLRKSDPPMVIDGPFAETKEQLLGFYVVDCDSYEEAEALARSLPSVNTVFEIRPVRLFFPGNGFKEVRQALPD